MEECMTFPDDWREFLKDYSFRDSEEVYTNGSNLIPVFRVEQLIEHLLAKQEPSVMRQNEMIDREKCICKKLGFEQEDTLYYRNSFEGGYEVLYIDDIRFCPVCGKELPNYD